VLWFKENRPEIYEKAWKIIHQTDYMVGRLCGEYGVSDYSDSLKTGYDLINDKWPVFFDKLGIASSKLPKIVAPGEPIGKISAPDG
jgi:xylulokinase